MNSIFDSGNVFDLDAVKLLKDYQFIECIYHPDGEGHVQVEIALTENLCSLSRIIEIIDHQQAWPSCMQMLSKQPQQWIMTFSRELQGLQSQAVTQCQVKLTDFLHNTENKLIHVQDSPSWYWHVDLLTLLIVLIEQIDEIESNLPTKDENTFNFNHEIFKQTRNQLLRIQSTLLS